MSGDGSRELWQQCGTSPTDPTVFLQVKVRLQTAPDGTYTGGMDVARKTFAKDGIAG